MGRIAVFVIVLTHVLSAICSIIREMEGSTEDECEGRPSLEQLIEWEAEGGCEATDGCWVEPDGTCPHEKPSWLIVLGMI